MSDIIIKVKSFIIETAVVVRIFFSQEVNTQGTYLKYGIDALPLCVSDSAQSVARNRTSQQTGHVRDDETHYATAESAQQAPELVVRPVVGLRHAFLAQHLLEDIGELLVLRLLAVLLLRTVAVLSLLGEEVPRPREGLAGWAGAGARTGARFSFSKGIGGVVEAACGTTAPG